MTKLEEASFNHIGLDIDAPEAFIKGALWLLEQARKLAYAEPNGMATEEIAFYEQLEELCQSEKE